MESFGNLFNNVESTGYVQRKVVILPPKTGGYVNEHTLTIPGGYKWTDFEKVEVGFTWNNYPAGASIEGITAQKEQIALNPTGWMCRSHVVGDEYAQFVASGPNTAILSYNDGVSIGGNASVLSVIGYLKEDIIINSSKTLIVPETAIAAGTSFPVSEPWSNFDTIEVNLEAAHTNGIRHTFACSVEPQQMKVGDRVSLFNYHSGPTLDDLTIWVDLTSETSWSTSIVTNGGNWSNIKITSIYGVKLGPQIIEKFVGRPNDNEFINGNMNIWQEDSGVEKNVVWGDYINDGWYAAGNGVKRVWKHVDSRKNWLAIAGGGVDSFKLIGQRKESAECLALFETDGYLTVSFLYGAKPEDTNTHLSCQVKGTSVLDDFTPANLIDIAATDQPLIKDDQPHLVTFTFKLDLEDPKFLNGLDIRIGSYNQTTPTLANPSTANLALTDCKLEWGRYYTKCIPENKTLELQRCLRYLEIGSSGAATGGSTNPQYTSIRVGFQVNKFKVPTLTRTGQGGTVKPDWKLQPIGVVGVIVSPGTHSAGEDTNWFINWMADARL